jgi:sugar porter (SP) family MFS transporter
MSSETAEFNRKSVLLVFLVPALGGALFGYDIAATAFVIQQLQSATYSGVSWFHIVSISPILIGTIVAISAIGAFCSSWIVFRLNDLIGRRQELRVGAILYLTGASIAALSDANLVNMLGSTAAISLLILGRFIFGCGIGFTMHGAPTYIAEMSPPSIRGTLISLKEAAIVLGILCGYGLGYAMSHVVGGWMYQYVASIPVAILVIGLTFYIPESARWLVLKEYEDEAQESLAFVFVSDDDVQGSLEGMVEQQKETNEAHALALERGQRDSIFSPARRAPLIAGVGLIVLQQITGQPSVLSYATVIFESVGLGGLASVIVAVFKLLATLGAAIAVEKFGRKSLLYIGCSLMLVALLTLVLSLGHYDSMDEVMGNTNGSMELRQVATIFAMFAYIGGYQIGFGPISWLMIGEVFPLSIRGQAVAFSVQMNFGLNFVVQLLVPILTSTIGLSSTFALFAVFTGYSLYFVHRHVPETKGLTLEEIEHQFERGSTYSVDQDGSIESRPLLA